MLDFAIEPRRLTYFKANSLLRGLRCLRFGARLTEMASISPEFVERYQIELEKNPRSRVFAPLAEAYRQMGLLEEAHSICSKGVQYHPDFAGGHVAFAKVLMEAGDHGTALKHLERATELSPDNLLAHSLMGETLLTLRRPKDALKAYKMVLFLNPNDERALKTVRKWEFLSADEYEDELFKMKPVFQVEPESATPIVPVAGTSAPVLSRFRERELDRAVSLADAFTVRGEPEKALAVLIDARAKLGDIAELERRISLLEKRALEAAEEYEEDEDAPEDAVVAAPEPAPPPVEAAPQRPQMSAIQKLEQQRKVLVLETLLRRIEDRRV